MNMSYCRFQNTRIDLCDCVCALEDILEEDKTLADALSEDEQRAAAKLYRYAKEYIELYEELSLIY